MFSHTGSLLFFLAGFSIAVMGQPAPHDAPSPAEVVQFNITTNMKKCIANITLTISGPPNIMKVDVDFTGSPVAWMAIGFGSTQEPRGITMNGTDIVMGILDASGSCVRTAYIAPDSDPDFGPNDAPNMTTLSNTSISVTNGGTVTKMSFTRALADGHFPLSWPGDIPFEFAYLAAPSSVGVPPCNGPIDPKYVHTGAGTTYVNI